MITDKQRQQFIRQRQSLRTDFDNWMNRPVYRVQCYTFKRALELCGKVPLAAGQGYATRGMGQFGFFRAKPQYRDEFARIMRDMVALSIRMERLTNRIGTGS